LRVATFYELPGIPSALFNEGYLGDKNDFDEWLLVLNALEADAYTYTFLAV